MIQITVAELQDQTAGALVDATDGLVKATSKLVFATWGLVGSTLALVAAVVVLKLLGRARSASPARMKTFARHVRSNQR